MQGLADRGLVSDWHQQHQSPDSQRLYDAKNSELLKLLESKGLGWLARNAAAVGFGKPYGENHIGTGQGHSRTSGQT